MHCEAVRKLEAIVELRLSCVSEPLALCICCEQSVHQSFEREMGRRPSEEHVRKGRKRSGAIWVGADVFLIWRARVRHQGLGEGEGP
jgi:hypothetical protein